MINGKSYVVRIVVRTAHLEHVFLQVSFAVAVFYNIVICWSLYFFVLSFSAILPWVDDTTGDQCPNTMLVSEPLSA